MKKLKKPTGFNPDNYPVKEADCYAYAINFDKSIDYVGKIAGFKNKNYFSKEEIINRLISDMEKMNVFVRESSYEEELSEWEWKICVFYVKNGQNDEYDYHFMREDQKGRWSHKFRNKKPTDKDMDLQTIIDPRLAIINRRYNYSFVGFFALCPL